MLSWAVVEREGPVPIRYPRGGDRDYSLSDWENAWDAEKKGLLKCHRSGNDVVFVTYGPLLKNAMDAAKLLSDRGIDATVLRLLTVSPLPSEQILAYLTDEMPVFVLEEVCTHSGIREDLAWEIHKTYPKCRVTGLDLGDGYVTHGNVDMLYKHYGLDSESISNCVQEVLRHEG